MARNIKAHSSQLKPVDETQNMSVRLLRLPQPDGKTFLLVHPITMQYVGRMVYEIEENNVAVKFYDNNGKEHRDEDDQPSFIRFIKVDNECHVIMMWYIHGEVHRENGKATQINMVDGKVVSEIWRDDEGCYHRDIGPSQIYVGRENAIFNYWYINGKEVPEEIAPNWRRLPPPIIKTMRILPLPIGDAILDHFKYVWQPDNVNHVDLSVLQIR